MLSLPPHYMVEIRGAEKGLLCKGHDLDFSDASGPTGSGEGTEVEAEALWFRCQPQGQDPPGALRGGSQYEKPAFIPVPSRRDCSVCFGTGKAMDAVRALCRGLGGSGRGGNLGSETLLWSPGSVTLRHICGHPSDFLFTYF